MKKTLKMMFVFIGSICVGGVLLYLHSASKEEKAGLSEKETVVTENNPHEIGETDEPEQNEKESDTLSAEFEAQCQMLSQINFGNDSSQWYTEEMQDDVSRYAEETKGEYEGSMFPPGLVDLLEKMIYQSLDSDMKEIVWDERPNGIYYRTADELGAYEFEIDFDEIDLVCEQLGLDADCEAMFHFHMTPERDNYLFVTNSGGSAGTRYVSLAELANGEVVWIGKFETRGSGSGRVIQYEGEFYYILLECNFNLKNYDGVRLYKLGENMEEKNLLIKYVPYEYCWNTIYDAADSTRIDDYLESVKEDIVRDYYMEMGKERDMGVFLGDMEEDEDFRLPGGNSESRMYYKADFTNTGVPIYMWISNFVPSNWLVWGVIGQFYIQNPENSEIRELEKMEIYETTPRGKNGLRLVQLWFKEIDGKVYTFCLYHASDYNYVLNTVLFEGTQVKRVRTDVLTPKRHFVLTEGEGFHAG